MSDFDVAGYLAARLSAAQSLRAVEASATEAGYRALAGIAGWQAGLLERPSPFAASAAELRQSWGPRGRLFPPATPGACYEASWGWVHVRPGCRCAR